MLRERFSEVSLVTLPPLLVACFRAVSQTPEDDAAAFLRRWASGVGLTEPPRSFGFDVEVSPEQAAGGLRGYELWYAVGSEVSATPPVIMRDFPGGEYAALTIFDPFSDPFTHIPAGWEALYAWVVDRGMAQTDERQWLEEVVEEDGGTHMILYYPVRSA